MTETITEGEQVPVPCPQQRVCAGCERHHSIGGDHWVRHDGHWWHGGCWAELQASRAGLL